MWSQIASPPPRAQVQPRRGELGDLRAAPGSHFHIEYLGSDHAAHSTFVHGEKMSTYPVPSLVLVAAIDTHHDFHLGLPPEAWIIWPLQAGPRIKIRSLILAITAYELDSRLGVWIFPKIIIGQKFEANFLRSSHLVFGAEPGPLASGADAILFVLIRTHGALLR